MKLFISRFFHMSVYLEGIPSISALIRASREGTARRRILSVLIEETKAEKEPRRVSFIRSSAAELGFSVRTAKADEIAALAQGRTHGGFLAEVTGAEYPGIDSLNPPETGFSVLAVGIEDPYTLAHSIRSLYLCGAGALILPSHFPAFADSVVARASAGTSELLPVYLCDPEEAVGLYLRRGYTVAAAGIRDSVDLDRAAIGFPLLLVIGGEKRGIPSSVAKKCGVTLRIPYARDCLASLPTESAVAVFAYELSRRQRLETANAEQ